MTLVFLDTETTGLSPHAEVWEIGMIVRGHRVTHYDGEWLFQVRPDMVEAEPMGLRIGRFYERFTLELDDEAKCLESPVNGMARTGLISLEGVAYWVCLLLDGANWVGAVPSFDELRLGNFVESNGWKLSHHYHILDIEPLAAGFIAGMKRLLPFCNPPQDQGEGWERFDEKTPPWDSKKLSAAIGARGPEEDEHTALGDARWVARMWDVMFGVPAA